MNERKNEGREEFSASFPTGNADNILKICIESLDLITNDDLIGSLANPNALLILVVEAVGVVLDVKPDKLLDPSDSSKKIYDYWGPMNILCDSDFLAELKSLDIKQLDPRIITKVSEIYKNNENFKPEKMSSISKVAACLCRWVLGVVDSFNAILFHNALTKGKKEWGRSKIMIVGQGRAGKTAFANSLIGKDFERTASTVGINELTCDVKHAAVGRDTAHWVTYNAPEKLYETALAKSMYDTNNGKAKSKSESVEIGGKDSNINGNNDVFVSNISDNQNIRPSNSGSFLNDTEGANNTNFSSSTVIDDNSKPNFKQKSPIKSPRGSEIDDGVSTMDGSDATSRSQQSVTQKAPKKRDIDGELVMKTLANKVVTESKFILSVYDFGGQEVFNVIHPFFLTRYGIYIVVFNMECIFSSDETVIVVATEKNNDDNTNSNDDDDDDAVEVNVEKCMAFLSFWINSIVVHTSHTSAAGRRSDTAPIAFVGTHKDKVSDIRKHKEISDMLEERFGNNRAFKNIIHYDSGIKGMSKLNFFPVDNTKSGKDPVMLNLMKSVEKKLDTLDYVHEEKDLAWFQILDAMHATKRSYLTYEEVQTMAQDYNVLVEDVSVMLSFFHQVGILMWHDEGRLKDVVIIDPVEYFVKPATLIICKHVATEDDKTIHQLDIHEKCKEEFPEDWKGMNRDGIFSLQSDSECFVYFSDLKKDGFLPSGLFERLIGRTLAWSQETYDISGSFQLNKNQVTLFFGSQMFRLTEMRDINCIRVEVDGSSPNLVYARLTFFLELIILECMKSLKFSALLEYKSGGDTEDQDMFVSLDNVRKIESNNTVLTMGCGGGRKSLNVKEAKQCYKPWMVNEQLLDRYDVFISYRWGHPDDEFVGKLFDRLTTHHVVENDNHRSIDTFYDKKRFQLGDQLQKEFCSALVKSYIFTPIISTHSLQRLIDDPTKEDYTLETRVDNMLLEWICALYCHSHYSKTTASSSVRIRKIMPIAFGTTPKNGDDTTTPIKLFDDPIMSKLAEKVPRATLKCARELLQQDHIRINIPLNDPIMSCTVKGIVEAMLKFNLVESWNIGQTGDVIKASAVDIHKLIEDIVVNTYVDDAVTVKEGILNTTDQSTINSNETETMKEVPFMQLIKEIKFHLEIDEETDQKPTDIINSAAMELGLTDECAKLKIVRDKANYILNNLRS
eukprot:gene218-395_t